MRRGPADVKAVGPVVRGEDVGRVGDFAGRVHSDAATAVGHARHRAAATVQPEAPNDRALDIGGIPGAPKRPGLKVVPFGGVAIPALMPNDQLRVDAHVADRFAHEGRALTHVFAAAEVRADGLPVLAWRHRDVVL